MRAVLGAAIGAAALVVALGAYWRRVSTQESS